MNRMKCALALAFSLAVGAAQALVPASGWYRGEGGADSSAGAEWRWYSSRFPWEGTDLAPDPSLRHGKLANGVRWLVYPHAQPKGRVAVWLDVQAGALAEKDSELGFAHIVEHMAFNGTRNYPAGSLIDFFHKNGMNFGGDTNASTSKNETVYKLNLASADEEALRKGLSVLRDYADGMLFLPEEVKAELGVSLSEKNARDSEPWRASRAYEKRAYKGTRFENAVIGEEQTIRSATPEGLGAFYRRWYRADRMVVVIAGDADPGLAQRLVAEQFGSLPRACAACEGAGVPAFGEPQPRGVRAYVTPYPDSSTAVMVRVAHPRAHRPDSRAESRLAVVNGCVNLMMNRRLLRRGELEPGVWGGARFSSSLRTGNLPYAALAAVTEGKGWDKALSALQEELALALARGFSEDELALAKAEFGKMLELEEKNFSATTNTDLAAQLISAINGDRVPTSPAQDLAFFAEVKDSVGLDDANAALREAFAPENRTIRVSGAASPSEAEVEKLWEENARKPLQARAAEKEASFPYLPAPAGNPAAFPAEFTSREVSRAPDLSLREARLPGGARLILQPLSFEKGMVKASLVFGAGGQQLPDDRSWLPAMADAALRQGGVGRLSRSESDRLVGVKGVSVAESSMFSAGVIMGQAPRAELPLLLEAVRTQFLDPHVSEGDFSRMMHAVRVSHHDSFETVGGASRWMPRSFFFGDLARFRPLEEHEGADARALMQYLEKARAAGPVTLVVSGDFDMELAQSEAERLFSGVKATPGLPRAAPMPRFPEGVRRTVVLPESTDKARFNLGWSAPLPDGDDRRGFWVRKMAASVLSDRLRAEIREKLGLTYSPWCAWLRSASDNGFGFFWLSVSTDPKGAAKVSEAVGRVIEASRRGGVSAEELEKLKLPALTGLETSRKTQGYWQSLMLREVLTGEPETARAQRDIGALRSVTAEDVSRLLAEVLAREPARLVLSTREPEGL